MDVRGDGSWGLDSGILFEANTLGVGAVLEVNSADPMVNDQSGAW